MIEQEVPKEEQEHPTKQEKCRVVAQIIGKLKETDPGARIRIHQIVKALGIKQSLALLEETLQIEASGGMMLPDGSRRRTPGGIWFLLAYTKGKPEEGRAMPVRYAKSKTKRLDAKPTSVQPRSPGPAKPQPGPVMNWEDRISAIEEASKENGELKTVKITLVGRPRKTWDKGSCMLFTMKDTKVPALPKGVPVPTEAGNTLYVVFMSMKQWRNVASVMDDPEDSLILEGYPQFDEKSKSIAVFVSSATTKKLQQAKRA